MPTQDQTTIIALFSAATSFLAVGSSLFTTYWSKRVDIKQRREDRNQELRKMYLARKLEVGEFIIGHWTLLINKLRWFDYYYAKYNFDNLPSADEYEEILAQEREINKLIEASNYTDKNYYYTYFDSQIDDPLSEDLSAKHNELRQALIATLDARAEINYLLGMGNPGGIHRALEDSFQEKRIEFGQLMQKYVVANREVRQHLLHRCASMRVELAKFYLD